ncbi:MAG: stalk domain-containing protein [Cellulosilyticaceae bacterium]
MRKYVVLLMICFLFFTHNLYAIGNRIPTQPEVLVRGSDMIVIAEVVEKKGMVNKVEVMGRDDKTWGFTADTLWGVKVHDVFKNTTLNTMKNGMLEVTTTGHIEATVDMGDDFELGKQGEYLLLFLKEQIDEEGKVYYKVDTIEYMIPLKGLGRDNPLQIANLKNQYLPDEHYNKCFELLANWQDKMIGSQYIYLFSSGYGGKYEPEVIKQEQKNYIAVRDLQHILGVHVEWNAHAKTVLLEDIELHVELIPHKNEAKIGGEILSVGNDMLMRDGKCFISFELLSLLLDKEIYFTSQGRYIIYNFQSQH